MKGTLSLALAALLSTAAFAQTPPSGSGSVFDQFDADHNGSVSQAEAQVNSTVMANFSTADADHDGKLSKAEFDAAFKPASQQSDQQPPADTQSTPPSDQPTTPPPSAQSPQEAPSTQPPQ